MYLPGGIDDNYNITFSLGELLFIGRQEIDHEAKCGLHEFVEVIMPRRGWINRVHFNDGVGYLRRIA